MVYGTYGPVFLLRLQYRIPQILPQDGLSNCLGLFVYVHLIYRLYMYTYMYTCMCVTYVIIHLSVYPSVSTHVHTFAYSYIHIHTHYLSRGVLGPFLVKEHFLGAVEGFMSVHRDFVAFLGPWVGETT